MSGITMTDMKCMASLMGLSVTKMGELSVGRRSYLWALARATFPKAEDTFISKLVIQMIGSEKKVDDAAHSCSLEVLKMLDPEERASFKAMEAKKEEEMAKAEVEKI
jgi:hypothetical protein